MAGSYRIERELGAGGMATVYLAHDLRHDRPVALKVLLPDLAHALGPERFQREIKLASRLQHPHILTVFDSGEAAGQLWYTMPFVAGETLRDRLTREKQLPVNDAIRITRDVALALDYAHRNGVIHRDIKPENILLADGQTLLADFGIGQTLGGETDERLTSTGLAIGTAAYMSPEQASAERDLDARTDIYSLAVVLYELLAGEPPFTGPTSGAILVRALTERPRPIHPVRDTVSAGLDAVINKAMAVTRADRYATGAEFAEALANPTEIAATSKPRSRLLVGAGVLAILLVAGVAGALLWPRFHLGGGHTRIAVLPFDNLGDTTDAYFVDGMTDAIRGKLTEMAGLEVIGRESMKEYRKTAKPPRQIGRELEVSYLLTGTIRFSGNGAARHVQVNPELVQVATAATKWNRAIDAGLTDVFKVQGDIAGEVAGTLNVALGENERRDLALRPTDNLDAYDALLRGDKAWDWPSNAAPIVNIRTAIALYQEAIKLDPRFAAAYGRLSRANVVLSILAGGTVDPAVRDSMRQLAERAVALDPDGPDGHGSLGFYYAYVEPVDLGKALQEYSRIRRLPADKEGMLRRVGTAEARLGREVGLTRLGEAVSISPRSAGAARILALQLAGYRQYPKSIEMADRSLSLDSSQQQVHSGKLLTLLAMGDRAGAKTAYAISERQVGPALPLLPLQPVYALTPLTWLLDRPQQARWLASVQAAAARGIPGVFEDRIAQYYWMLGDSVSGRTYAQAAKASLETALAKNPAGYLLRVRLGLMLALLDQKRAAIEQGTQAVAALAGNDVLASAAAKQVLARIYLLAGEPEQALGLLESLLKGPGFLTPAWLRMDPTWGPLKGNPRFERLIASR